MWRALWRLRLTIDYIEWELKFDLSDHLSEERVERNWILCGLLNGDTFFFVKLNFGKQIAVSLRAFFVICFVSFLSKLILAFLSIHIQLLLSLIPHRYLLATYRKK